MANIDPRLFYEKALVDNPWMVLPMRLESQILVYL